MEKTTMQAKGIWEQDPEANIWAQEGLKLGVQKVSEWFLLEPRLKTWTSWFRIFLTSMLNLHTIQIQFPGKI